MSELGLDQLTTEERLMLVEELWDSILADNDAFVLSDAQKQDLQRRLDAFCHDPKAGSPWAKVKSRMKLSKK